MTTLEERAKRYAGLLVRIRNRLEAIVSGLEDEGDRVYFGSSNDADDLKEIWNEMDALRWEKIIAVSQLKASTNGE